MLYSIVGILVIILDQLVKLWVDNNIHEGNVIELIPKVLSLVRVQNDGAAFSFLSGGSARIWFIALTAFFAILVVLALATNFVSGRFGRWCLVLITAGGLSNMIDRIRFGYVIDMFKIELFDFAVFNVADIFIAVFCIAFILYILFGGEKLRDPDADEFEEDEDYEEEIRSRRPRTASSKRDRYEKEEEKEEESQPRPRKRPAAADNEKTAEERSVGRKPRSSTERSAASVASAPTREPSRENPPSRQQGRTRPASPTSADRQATEQAIRRRTRAASQETERTVAEARSKAKAAASRNSDAMFEEMFAHKESGTSTSKPKSERPPRRESSAPSAGSSTKNADPFAEWEKANERVREDARTSYQKAAAAAAKPVKAVSDASQDAYSDFLATATSKPAASKQPKPAAPASKTQQPPARKPAPAQQLKQQAAPKKNPAPTPAVSVSEEDFDLDSIINEFK